MSDKKILIGLNHETNPKFKNMISKIIYESSNFIRNKETAIVNAESESSISLNENGDVKVIAGNKSQQKNLEDGKSGNINMNKKIIANKVDITADDIVINKHKLNPKLWEFTDMREVLIETEEKRDKDGNLVPPMIKDEHPLVGNFCILGSVMTISWDHTLNKYVLIRRPARIPMFSNTLNTASIKKEMHITDSIEDDFIEMMIAAGSTKDYEKLKADRAAKEDAMKVDNESKNEEGRAR